MVRRLLAAASAASLLAALGVAISTAGVSAGGSSRASVTFTSLSSAVSVVTSHSISPAGSGGATASGNVNQSDGADTGGKSFTALSPKGDRYRSENQASGGVPFTALTAASATPATSSSFAGQAASNITCSYFATGCNPPDMAVAASPSRVFQGVNSQFAVYDTAGDLQPGWPVSAQNFFGVPNVTNADGTPCDTAHGSQPFLSDPRAAYDTADGRFWAAMLQVENVFGVGIGCPFLSVIWVAVSQTGDPSGAWNVYEFNTSLDGQFANDYTQLGLNGSAVFISANMFGPSTGLNGGFYAEVFEANKAKMEAGSTDFTPDAFYDMRGFGPGSGTFGPFIADTVQPAVNYDASTGSSEMFADTIDGPDLNNGHLCGFAGGGFNQACKGIVVWQMTNPTAHDGGGGDPTFTGHYVATAPFLLSPPQTQPSCSQCVDALDLRMTGTPVVRGGVLYGSWDTALNSPAGLVPGLEWAAVQLNNPGGQFPTVTGYYASPDGGSASFGTLMPDAQGNLTMVFDHMSSTTFPEIRYITKAAGAANFSGPGVVLKAGESSYRPQLCGTPVIPVCRWGDYEATGFDGAGHIWFASQYANLYGGIPNPPQFGRNWSTWIGAIAAS